MRLSLNLRFADVNDPKGLCKDVTGIGRWGNGDVEIGISKLEDLPYVIGLVRQSLELQLGFYRGINERIKNKATYQTGRRGRAGV